MVVDPLQTCCILISQTADLVYVLCACPPQAPEQFEGHPVNEKVDVYAFAVTMWVLQPGYAFAVTMWVLLQQPGNVYPAKHLQVGYCLTSGPTTSYKCWAWPLPALLTVDFA